MEKRKLINLYCNTTNELKYSMDIDLNIDIENSHHSTKYLRQIKRMETVGPAAPFTLPAEAVLKKVIHALESNKPKARYYVTFPTYLFGYLKRILPTRWLDKVLLYVSKSEMK